MMSKYVETIQPSNTDQELVPTLQSLGMDGEYLETFASGDLDVLGAFTAARNLGLRPRTKEPEIVARDLNCTFLSEPQHGW